MKAQKEETQLKYLSSSLLKEKYKMQLKETIKSTFVDENGFVRIDPRFLTNI